MILAQYSAFGGVDSSLAAGVLATLAGVAVTVAAIVVGWNAWDQYKRRQQPKKQRLPGMRYITHDEYREGSTRIDSTINGLTLRIEAHEKATRERSEKLTDSLHKIELRLADTAKDVVTVVDNALKPIESSIGTMQREIATLAAGRDK